MRCSKILILFFGLILLCCFYGCRQNEARLFKNKERIWSIMAKETFQPGDSARYMRMLDSLYQSGSEKGPYEQWERYKIKSGYFYYFTDNYEKALLYTDSMLDLFGAGSSLPYAQELYLKGLYMQGDILVKSKRFDEAFAIFYEARQFHLSRNDTCGYSEYTSRLAMVSYELHRYAEAIDYYQQLLLEGSRCNRDKFDVFYDVQGTLDNIGICYRNLGRFDSAEHYFRRALVYIEDHKMELADRENFVLSAQAVIYGNMASMFVKQKRYDEAEDFYNKSIFINIDPQRAPNDAAINMNSLAAMYLQTGKIEKIAPLFARIDSLRRRYPGWAQDPEYLPTRAKYAIATGQPALAYRLLEQAVREKDSLNNETNIRSVPDMRVAYERLGSQYKLQIANRRKTELLQLSIIFGLLLLAILVLLWRSYRRTQRTLGVLNVLHAEMRQKNEHLLSTLEELQQVSREKQKMTHVVVHDLRGPIGSISSIAQMYTEDESIHDPAELKDVLRMIASSAQSALTLIMELMNDRDMEQKARPEKETVEMQSLLRYCINILQHRADGKFQSISLSGSEARIEGNKEKLIRIFHNLLDNAIKFSPHRSRISIHVALLRSHVQVSVTDDGIGMPSEMQKEIDKERSLANRAGTDGEQSFGLGLSIVYQLMEEHQGTIWFKSADGKGTTFYLEFPLH